MSIKSFDEFMQENYTSGIATYTKPIGTVKRHKLPNIVNDNDFLEDVESNSILITIYSDETGAFTPTQNEFNNDKVRDIVKNNNFDKPILVSADNYIVDGHHRWKAAEYAGINISVKKIDMGYTDLVDFLKDKSYVANKKINEDKL